MFKVFKDQFQIRSLIVLFLLLSNIHPHPGPFSFMSTIGIDSTPKTITVPLNKSYSSVKVQFSMIATSGTASPLVITSSVPNLHFSFNPLISTSAFDTLPMEIGPLSTPFTFTFTRTQGTYHVLTSVSAYNVTTGGIQDVRIVNSSIEPVPTLPRLTSNDPLPITGEVSIVNPIPSITTSLFNSFRK